MTNRPLLGLRFAVRVSTGFSRHIVSVTLNSLLATPLRGAVDVAELRAKINYRQRWGIQLNRLIFPLLVFFLIAAPHQVAHGEVIDLKRVPTCSDQSCGRVLEIRGEISWSVF